MSAVGRALVDGLNTMLSRDFGFGCAADAYREEGSDMEQAGDVSGLKS